MSSFRTTLWSQLNAAGQGEESALDSFVRRYRPPLLSFLRSRGLKPNEAEDLAQEVFLRLLKRDLLLKADAAKGRFRSYLLGVTLHVLSDHRRRAQAAKRGGGWEQVPLEIANPASAEQEFASHWLAELVRRSLEKVKEASAYEHELLGLTAEGLKPREIAERLGRSPGAVRVALHSARKRLGQALSAEVARYSSSEEEHAEELSYFLRRLGHGPS